MTRLEVLLKKMLRDVVLFTRYASSLKLRRYQEAVAQAVARSVIQSRGLSFVVIFPRQSGKNELQAQLQTYFLTLFSGQPREIVQISPTWKPQTQNAMHRLERVLSRNLIVRDRWRKDYGHIYQVDQSRIVFLSGSPTSNIVGATANMLLSIDEAQDIQTDKFDKEIAPMAASTNATRIFWGTAWTSRTLLAREYKAAKAAQDKDGIQRVWRLTADDVAAEVKPYGKFVADQIAKLGRNHPMVRTQYYSEDIDAEGGLFPPARLALLRGIHPPQSAPEPNQIYVMTLDVAGEDESDQDPVHLANPTRDSTALTIAKVDTCTINDPAIQRPTFRIVYRQTWVGVKHTSIYPQILALAEAFHIRYLVCDATGVGAGLTSFLARPLGEKVIPFTFNSATKSKLGWSFLALVDSGRLKDYAMPEDATGHKLKGPQAPSAQCKPQRWGRLADLQTVFFRQLEFCQYEILTGPEKKIKWSVPDGTRNPATGDLIHDDLVITAAMLSLLDDQPFTTTGPAAVVTASDPLDDMKGF